MNAITKAPAPMLPGLVDERHLQKLVESFNVSMEGSIIYADRLPDAVERKQLQEINADITRSLRPCSMSTTQLEDAKTLLDGWFAGYANLRTMEAQESADLINAYLLVLQKYPLFAIAAAIDDVMSNRVRGLSLDYVPTSPRMGAIAADHVSKLAAKQIKVDQVLRASRLIRAADTPGARERVMASLRDFHGKASPVDGVGTFTEAERKVLTGRQRKEAQQAVLNEWKHLGLSPIYNGDGSVMSPALARQLGRLSGPEAAIR